MNMALMDALIVCLLLSTLVTSQVSDFTTEEMPSTQTGSNSDISSSTDEMASGGTDSTMNDVTSQVSLPFNSTSTTPSPKPDNLGLILGLSLGLGIPLLIIVGLLIYWALRRNKGEPGSHYRTAF